MERLAHLHQRQLWLPSLTPKRLYQPAALWQQWDRRSHYIGQVLVPAYLWLLLWPLGTQPYESAMAGGTMDQLPHGVQYPATQNDLDPTSWAATAGHLHCKSWRCLGAVEQCEETCAGGEKWSSGCERRQYWYWGGDAVHEGAEEPLLQTLQAGSLSRKPEPSVHSTGHSQVQRQNQGTVYQRCLSLTHTESVVALTFVSFCFRSPTANTWSPPWRCWRSGRSLKCPSEYEGTQTLKRSYCM